MKYCFWCCIHLFGTGLGVASLVTSWSGIRFGLDLLCMWRFSFSVTSSCCMFTALNVPFTCLNCVLYTLPFQAADATSNVRQKWNCWSFFKDIIQIISFSLTSHCLFWCLDVIISIVSYSFYHNELLLCLVFFYPGVTTHLSCVNPFTYCVVVSKSNWLSWQNAWTGSPKYPNSFKMLLVGSERKLSDVLDIAHHIWWKSEANPINKAVIFDSIFGGLSPRAGGFLS